MIDYQVILFYFFYNYFSNSNFLSIFYLPNEDN